MEADSSLPEDVSIVGSCDALGGKMNWTFQFKALSTNPPVSYHAGRAYRPCHKRPIGICFWLTQLACAVQVAYSMGGRNKMKTLHFAPASLAISAVFAVAQGTTGSTLHFGQTSASREAVARGN